MSRRRTRPLTYFALALALILAQTGALLHASSHFDAAGDRSGIHAQLCVQCLSYSGVLAAAGGQSMPFVPAIVGDSVPALTAVPFLDDRSSPAAFRPRAPPRTY